MEGLLQETLDYLRKAGKIILLVVGSLFAAIALIILFWGIKFTYNYQYGYDRQEWLNTPRLLQEPSRSPQDNPREHMVEDVMAHSLQPGMSRQAVIQELGPPEEEYSERMLYQVGWSFLDPDWLVIKLNKGKVVQYEIENH